MVNKRKSRLSCKWNYFFLPIKYFASNYVLPNHRNKRKRTSLDGGKKYTAGLTYKFVKILWMAEIRHEWENSKALYILEVNKDNKVVIQKLELIQIENNIRFVVFKTAEVEIFVEGTEYSIINECRVLWVVMNGSIIYLNLFKLSDHQIIFVYGRSEYRDLSMIQAKNV